MANPRKPHSLKLIAGTVDKSREISNESELPLLKTPPKPPKWLKNEHALEAWDRLAAIYTANGLLTVASVDALAHMCALHGRVLDILEGGEAPPTSMSALLRNYHSDFGMTPVSRSKVAPADLQVRNPFDALDDEQPNQQHKQAKRKH